MSIRIILAPLFGSDADAIALLSAMSLARRFQAHVQGLFVRTDPMDAVPIIGEGVSPAVITQLTEAAKVEIERQWQAAKGAFEAACAQTGVTMTDRPGDGGAASAELVDAGGRRHDVIPRRARLSDLVVFGRSQADEPIDLRSIVESTLLDGGRPLLLVPHGHSGEVGRSVGIAWNGSAQAAHAVTGAMPVLREAASVHILTAETRRTAFETSAELARYLAWRGVDSTPRQVTVGDDPVGASLLRTVAETGADLLVMGGYGRTRLSELVMGGVTRHVMAEAELPVLLAH